jgi:hypothetical protein
MLYIEKPGNMSRRIDPQVRFVITTYPRIVADGTFGFTSLDEKRTPVKWRRIVLDESHFIRNGATQGFKAISAHEASIRWCLSGTPLNNHLQDVVTQCKFLRIPRLGLFFLLLLLLLLPTLCDRSRLCLVDFPICSNKIDGIHALLKWHNGGTCFK